MRARTAFVVIIALAFVVAAIFAVNARIPQLVDPIATPPPPTQWVVPVINTVTVSPTMMGEGGGWYSDMPTPVPVQPRNVPKPSVTPTFTVTP